MEAFQIFTRTENSDILCVIKQEILSYNKVQLSSLKKNRIEPPCDK